ncbi:hypothetical protein L226DRAFT_536630 [Lentinus tigrinus ALCF2SS1-7]|uniref:Uncharacterized protein n=1 Tax=Lentinus tigrinus ALCF2SS1-6 TaxID=1328759 RepID=A0A5C2S1C1_9APHY|nr:hypothetical protein L227DRAFT_578121 [Lentinus tigrinus ALCF2SS1-6]RPD73131.1 hypothetical protein L226DRAFT_536630 [Lentinus tigrinus ALCF2SS1-7]
MPHKRAKRSVREQKRKESGSDLAPSPGLKNLKKAIESEGVPKSVARVLNAAHIQQEWAQKKKRKGLLEDEAGPSRKRRRQGERGDGLGGGEGAGIPTRGSGKQSQTQLQLQLRITPGESMAHFNRRVEDSMRHSVREAIQTSSARMRQVRKEETASSEKEKEKGRAADGQGRANAKARDKSRAREQSDSDDDSESPRAAKAKAKTKEKTKTKDTEERPREFEKVSTSAPKRLNDIVQAPPDIKKLPRKAKKLAAQGGAALKGDGAKSVTLSEGVRSMAQKAMLEEERERVIRLYREMKKGKVAG